MSVAANSERAIGSRLRAAGLELSGGQVERLAHFLELLDKWGRVFNLTGIRDFETQIDRNLVECLALGRWLHGQRIADVGTGAGLPGVPLAIVEPERRFSLIESRAKRVRFLLHAVGELGLDNVEILHRRAEDLPSELAFATVLARAVAPPLELLALARHLTVSGSRLLLLTSRDRSEELANLDDGFTLRTVETAHMQGQRSAIVVLERTND
jgi:16S rRNA (guanine527-N7)-methyltransferase